MNRLSWLLLRSNLGSRVERVWVLFVNVPTVWTAPKVSVLEYLNSFVFTTSVTKNVPLNPLFSTPSEFDELLTFLTIIWSPIFTLWGLSVRIVTLLSPVSNDAWDMNLVLRSNP